jgi:hypothetical protein
LTPLSPPAPPTPSGWAACSALGWPRSPRPPISESGQQLRHEHTLLYSIINTVTDPILLTDADGRIMIANARAEALLATGEDQSEGRRRAVALNNMMFSGRAVAHALEGAAAPRREVPLADPVDGSDLLFEVMSTVTSDAREGTGRGVGAPQRHRPAARDGGDRGELPRLRRRNPRPGPSATGWSWSSTR